MVFREKYFTRLTVKTGTMSGGSDSIKIKFCYMHFMMLKLVEPADSFSKFKPPLKKEEALNSTLLLCLQPHNFLPVEPILIILFLIGSWCLSRSLI